MADKLVGTIDLTVVRASGFPDTLSNDTATYISVRIGNQEHETMPSRGCSPVWNTTFTFTTEGPDDVEIGLHKVNSRTNRISPRCDEGGEEETCRGDNSRARASSHQLRVLGRTRPERFARFGPKNQEFVKHILTESGRKIAITCRISETIPRPKSRTFALIVGIDEYRSRHHNLNGCVNDAKAVKLFLNSCLHVPHSNICFLANGSATRDAIINGFRSHLIQNTAIDENDTIVIFFAGHGSSAPAPSNWPSTSGKIELLVPHDEGCEGVHGISDRTINALLHQLAAAKGNNITVIVDTCHAGGMTRSHLLGPPPADDFTPRTVLTTEPIPATLDDDIWGLDTTRSADTPIPTGFLFGFMESHVLLAACRQEEAAYESMTREGFASGLFTNALVDRLRQVASYPVTYVELIRSLPSLRHQTPQCEGNNKDRRLFDTGNVEEKTFALFRQQDGFEVHVGSIAGVVEGTEFSLRPPGSGHLKAVHVNLGSSLLLTKPGTHPPIFNGVPRVEVSSWNNNHVIMKVFASPELPHNVMTALFPDRRTVLSRLRAEPSVKQQFIRSASRNDADIVLAQRQDSRREFVIERQDALIPVYARQKACFSLHDARRLSDILNAIAHFNFYLQLRHDSDHSLQHEVTMELYRLGEQPGSQMDLYQFGEQLSSLMPMSNNLFIEAGAKLGKEESEKYGIISEANVLDDETDKYGIAITNRSCFDIFPYLFYFDPGDYSIEPWYAPPSSSMTAPLYAQRGGGPSRVTVGYGAGGGYTIEFSVPEKETTDTGFLKLFVSTAYMDLSWIKQTAPFQPNFIPRAAGVEKPAVKKWDAWTAALTVERRKVEPVSQGRIVLKSQK